MAVSAYLAEGVRLFQDGQYFLCHETLEEHWVEAPEEERDFYQGLIHLAVGFLHHDKGNTKGAKLQFGKAAKRLQSYPDVHQEIDVGRLKEFLQTVPAALDTGETLTPPRLFRPVG